MWCGTGPPSNNPTHKHANTNNTKQARSAGHEKATAESGPWLFTLDFPSYYPVMTHAKNRCGRGGVLGVVGLVLGWLVCCVGRCVSSGWRGHVFVAAGVRRVLAVEGASQSPYQRSQRPTSSSLLTCPLSCLGIDIEGAWWGHGGCVVKGVADDNTLNGW